MAKEILTKEIDAFLISPIVTWFSSCLNGRSGNVQLTYEELVDGVFIYDVILQMDIDGQSNDVTPAHNNPGKRLANLESVLHLIRHFYEDHLGQVILRLPRIHLIAQEPRSNICQVELLLLLLLGCAVKCRNNEYFVHKITLLDEDTQAALAAAISKILHVPDIVLSKEMLLIDSAEEEQLFNHKQKVQQAIEGFSRMSKERNELLAQLYSASSQNVVQSCKKELYEWEAEVIVLTDQVDHYKRNVASLESENKRLLSEVECHRETLEDISELMQQQEQSSQELGNYKEKLKKMSSYKTLFEKSELKNRLLIEEIDKIDTQLKSDKAEFAKRMREMKREIRVLQRKNHDLETENQANCTRNFQICEENADLKRRVKFSNSMNVYLDDSFDVEADETFNQRNNNSLSEELSQSVHSQVLKLDLESRRLKILEENSVLENSLQLHDLEKEKNRLESIVKDLNAKVGKLEEKLTSANIENMQLRDSVRSAENIAKELENTVFKLECEKNREEKSIDAMQINLDEDSEDYSSDENLIMSVPERSTMHPVQLNLYSNSDDRMELQERNSNEEYRKEKLKVDELTERHKDYEKQSQKKTFQFNNENRLLRVEVENLTDEKARLQNDIAKLQKMMSKMYEYNDELIAKTFETQEQYHKEDKKKDQTLHNLARAKAKLEEKLMCQFREMENRRETKKRSAAISAVKNTITKVQRAGSELFSKAKRSIADDINAERNKPLDDEANASRFENFAMPRKDRSSDSSRSSSPERFSLSYKDNRW
ncbi:girdin-like isoform X2 [Phymastichus coffea]|uniref:girdin-like isoform X2 n=1 Tax=Phymastichus coffea TaxID=108790 RepID=UPI00273A91D8|nr:girdin-like isoform X2 [Phymastichus coffea]